MLPINILAVIVSAIVAFILGFLFHGPVLGKLWMKLADVHPTGDEKFSDMVPQMLWNLLSNFVSTLGVSVIYLFASSSAYLSGAGVWGGIIVALVIWLGIIVAGSSAEVIWMGRKAKLWLFECMCSFIVMAVVGAIIAGWK